MQKKAALTRSLILVGVTLVWIPLLAPFVFMLLRVSEGGHLLFDFLLPAELFPLALVGGGLLLWASMRAGSRRSLMAWGMGGMIGALVGSQVGAVATGLASGAHEPTGWRLAVVASLMGLYVLALVLVAVTGVLLVRDTSPRHTGSGTAAPG